MIIVLLFGAIAGVIVGAIIGESKGRAGEGAVLGGLLGPIGWLVVGLGPDYKAASESRKCPFCAELVKREATVCKHCGRELPFAAPAIIESVPEIAPWRDPLFMLKVAVIFIVVLAVGFLIVAGR